MKLKNYLEEESALDLPEPEVGKNYPPEKVKRYKEIIDKAIKAMQNKKESDANDAVIADLRDKKEKWSNVDKETKPTKTKTEVPPEQKQDDDPDVGNPPPEEEEPPPEKEEEPPPDGEEEEEAESGDEEEEDPKKKKKKKKNPFAKKEEYDLFLMTPLEKYMNEVKSQQLSSKSIEKGKEIL